MSNTVQLGPGLWMIDLMFGGIPGVIAAFLLADERTEKSRLALIETGPASTVDTLWNGIIATGHDPERVDTMLVTHIHLDHSGAAGVLAARLPTAQVLVHEAGARHLIDPSRLLASAALIYQDRMETLWGITVPVPAQQVQVVQDDEHITVAGRDLRALYTPGHARHHIAYHEPRRQAIFTGDVAGIRLPNSTYVRPPTPPPDLDVEAWDASIDRLREVVPRTLYLTHCGPSVDADTHLVMLRERIHAWRDLIEEAMATGATTEAIVAQLAAREVPLIQAQTTDPGAATAYELAANYAMSVAGFQRYLTKRAS